MAIGGAPVQSPPDRAVSPARVPSLSSSPSISGPSGRAQVSPLTANIKSSIKVGY